MRRQRLLVPVAVILGTLVTNCGEGVVPFLVRAPITMDATVTPVGDSLAVTPDPIVVLQGDTVRWYAVGVDGDSLWIHLDQVSGFDDVPLSAPDTVVVVITTTTNPGDYKYAVTLWVDGTPIFVDPRLIVRERGEG